MMLAIGRKPSLMLAALFIGCAAPAALHVVGTRTATTTTTGALGGTTATPAVPTAASTPKIGMNLSGLAGSADSPLLNRAKLGSEWSVRGVTTDASLKNADGYPIAMPPGGGFWETNVALDPPTGTSYAQNYLVRWKGTGSISLGLVNQQVFGDHQATFANVWGGVLININATDPNDPIRDVSVVRADQVADFDAGKTFNPSFVNRVVKPFASFRTMDWDLTNNSKEANWIDRQKPGDANYTRMPLELEVALANEGGVDLWKTIPALATDDYVRQTLIYIKANLSPLRKLHLEYSNEVWNGAFQQSQYAAQQAQALWQVSSWAANTYYGFRSAQIAAIAWSVFGSDSTQLKPVLAGWYGWLGSDVTDAMTRGVAYSAKGTIPALFREYAIAPYFGDAFGIGPGNEADRAIVMGWAKDPTPAGLDKAFRQLEHGGLLAAKYTSLDDAKYVFEPKHQAWAKQNSLALVAYEGGLSFYYYMADTATKQALTAFFNRMIADPRMAQLYTRWATDFALNGGTLIENYNDTGTIGEWGPWGSLPNIYADDTPRYLAMKTLNAL